MTSEERQNLLHGGLGEAEGREDDDELVRVEDGGSDSMKINSLRVPLGTWLLEQGGFCYCSPRLRRFSYKALIYLLTFCSYTTYHLSRKPFSVVKPVLCPVCADENGTAAAANGWYPFNSGHGKTLMGSVDYSWLFAYAVAMYFSGLIGDRMNLRYFLTFGMLGSSISVALLGVAYFLEIHHIWYFILVQLFGGAMQSTGWPGVVAVMGHWFGKQRRGFIMGLWNSHTSVGNILGTVIPSIWAEASRPGTVWGWSFLVPAFIMAAMAMLVFLFLVNDPTDVGLPPPVHHLGKESVNDVTVAGNGTTVPANRGGVNDTVTLNEEGEGEGEEGEGEEGEGEGEGERGEEAPSPTEGLLAENATCSSGIQSEPPPTSIKPIGFIDALRIPGVIEYALALFFNKLVSYTFLFWLPLYVKATHAELTDQQSDWLSTLFDVGGIIGGIVTGVLSDFLEARAVTCVAMLILAVPSLFFLDFFGSKLPLFIVFLIVSGITVNGPYAIITTAVSSDLGTHKSLQGKTNAKATVTAIIDGTGSLGAALGPLLVGLITDSSNTEWKNAFYMLMASVGLAALFLTRLVLSDLHQWYRRWRFQT